MANPWMPGLRHDPGQSAGYNAGRNRMYMVVDHDTGGVNSYNVCKFGRPGYDAGLCQILLPKVGTPWQFCEIDAICYHAGSAQYGNYNDDGPGFEVERFQGEPLSPDQTHWLGEINRWLAAEWGVPNVHYWGPQFPPRQANFHGHVNHRDVHPNPDGLSPAEWDAVTGSSGGSFTVGQMEDIAQWEKDTRKIILEVLVGPNNQATDKGILGAWEKETRRYIDEQIKASEKRIIEAIYAR